MSDDQSTLAAFDGLARLFPLPNLVLFPQGLQGLHIFEPRYRRMTADALAGDHLIAPVLLQPGWEHETGELPPIAAVACLGRIDHHEELADGRFNLRVRGLARIKLIEEVRTDRPYRIARSEPMPDVVLQAAALAPNVEDVAMGAGHLVGRGGMNIEILSHTMGAASERRASRLPDAAEQPIRRLLAVPAILITARLEQFGFLDGNIADKRAAQQQRPQQLPGVRVHD